VGPARENAKPVNVVQPDESPEPQRVIDWIAQNGIRVLNVAGPGAEEQPRIYALAINHGMSNRMCVDYSDVLAIAGALTCREMRFVSVKTTEQQDMQALYRLQERRLADRTALCNQLRGLLAQGYRQIQALYGHIDYHSREAGYQRQRSETCRRLQTIPGYGPVMAGVFHSAVAHGEAHRRGRDVSAAPGLVPDSIAAVEKRCCRVSASAGTDICAACWYMAPVRW